MKFPPIGVVPEPSATRFPSLRGEIAALSAYRRFERARWRCIPTQPCVAPHTAKIHTLITLGIRIRAKPLVFKARNVVPRGFDSHCPLHFQATPGHVGLQIWDQDIDPMGKSWEFDAQREEVSLPRVSLHCPRVHTYSHTQQFTKLICVIPTLHA
jgi:hypothetical protein